MNVAAAAAACNWHAICYNLNAVTEGEGSTDIQIDWPNKAVVLALVYSLLTELLISQNTTAEHVVCMKQIVCVCVCVFVGGGHLSGKDSTRPNI